MIDFLASEIRMLIDDGYWPGFMSDIREDDLIAIAPVSRTPIWNDERDGDQYRVRTRVVQRIFAVDGTYLDEHDDLVRNVIITFIGIDLDGLPHHERFGSTYPVFIKRGE